MNKEYLLEEIQSLQRLQTWLQRIAVLCGTFLIGILGIGRPLLKLQHTNAEDVSLVYVEALLWIATGIMFVLLFYIICGCVNRVEKNKQENLEKLDN